ncbi:MAG: hypothetical protein ACEPOW_07900 [Bacteroidales bacterium]
MEKTAIVTLYKDLGNDKGYVVAHHMVLEDGRLKKLNLDQRTEEFPKRGQVFIENGYNELCSKFDKEEPFLLRNCVQQDHEFTLYKSSGSYAQKLYPIIEGAPGIRQNFQFILPHVRAVFFSIQGGIQGPYAVHDEGLDREVSYLNEEWFSYSICRRNYTEIDPDIDPKYNSCIIRICPENEEDKDYTVFAPSLRQRFIHDVGVLLRTFPKERKELILDISQKELFEWGENTFKHVGDLKPELFEQIRPFFMESTESAHEVDRLMFDHYFHEIQKTVKWKEYLVAFTKNYLTEDEGQNFLTSFLERRKDRYISGFISQYKEEIEAAVSDKKNELELLEADILKMESDKDRLREEARENSKQELLSLTTEITDKRKELVGILDKINKGNDVTDLLSQTEELTREKLLLLDNIKDLESTLKLKQEDFQESSRQKIAELKPYFDLLNGINPSKSSDKSKWISEPVDVVDLKRFEGTLKDYVLLVHEELKQNKVMYPVLELANYLVAIQQNFLTIFAGHPGVGKTYTAEALSKISSPYSNFLSISVNRGWRSSKDLIGCFNPLTNQYQASKTGLYRKLRKHADEISDKGVSGMYRVVLDEANLSPMEHYWADMIKFSDDYERKLPVNDGENETFKLGEGIRFIGTINYDHTTEPLSARLIDRVPIITIEPIQHYDIDMVYRNNAEFSSSEIWEAESIHQLFVPELDEDADYVSYIKQIVNVMHDSKKGEQIIVSKRKYKKIMNYCALCWDLFYELKENDSDRIKAIDLAVIQFILPAINGHGNGYKEKLKSLREVCVELELERSSSRIKRILEKGEMFNNYNFFS